MSEQDEEQTAEQSQGEASASQPEEPQTLEEAMRAVREADSSGVAEAVESTEDAVSGTAESDNEKESSEQTSAADSVQLVEHADAGGADGGARGYAAPASNADYSAARQQLLESVTRSAARTATQEFRDNNVEKLLISQLYQRDENTGQVSFINPDDPSRPFSSRAEAQAWIDAYNAQIDQGFSRRAQELQREYAANIAPSVRLLDFAPTYNSLPAGAQKTMDMIIEPYSVYDNQGRVVGFSCDLTQAANMAVQIDSQYRSTANRASAVASANVAPAERRGPATDMKTKGSEASGTATGPKDLNEAMKLYNEQQKAERKAKK